MIRVTVTAAPADQNHVGGAAEDRALAAAIGLEPGATLLDIGTGLGGTPRLLAEESRCRCHGVELTEQRFRDAVRLTQLAGLDHPHPCHKGLSGAQPSRMRSGLGRTRALALIPTAP